MIEVVYVDKFWVDIVFFLNVFYIVYIVLNDLCVLEFNMVYWEFILVVVEKFDELCYGLDYLEIMKWLLGFEFMFMEWIEIF